MRICDNQNCDNYQGELQLGFLGNCHRRLTTDGLPRTQEVFCWVCPGYVWHDDGDVTECLKAAVASHEECEPYRE